MIEGKDDLEIQLFDGEISLLEYLQQSPEYCADFKQFCDDYGLMVNEESANRFQDWLLYSEEDDHIDGLD